MAETRPSREGARLRRTIDALPRVRLAALPTPLDFCPRLSERLGGPKVYVKRDDLTGLAFGGNKVRQLEFVFGELLARGCDAIIAGADTQSNQCRLIAAAAAKLGLHCSLILDHGCKGAAPQGNLLLDHILGADVEAVAVSDTRQLYPLYEAKAAALSRAGHAPYVVAAYDVAYQALAAIGYVLAAVEIDDQCAALGIAPTRIYLSGVSKTPAGLMVGMRALGRGVRIVGVTPKIYPEPRRTAIALLATAISERLDLGLRFSADEVSNEEGYVGAEFGVPTTEGMDALFCVARCEGLLLDPVYTGKAFAALVHDVEVGVVGPGETVVFLHTGGTPAIFAYADEIVRHATNRH